MRKSGTERMEARDGNSCHSSTPTEGGHFHPSDKLEISSMAGEKQNIDASSLKKCTCKVCGFKDKMASVVDHVIHMHSGSIPGITKLITFTPGQKERKLRVKKDAKNNFYKCPYCTWESHRKDRVIRHARGHTHEKPYECNLCGLKRTQQHQIARHIWNEHEAVAVNVCIPELADGVQSTEAEDESLTNNDVGPDDMKTKSGGKQKEAVRPRSNIHGPSGEVGKVGAISQETSERNVGIDTQTPSAVDSSPDGIDCSQPSQPNAEPAVSLEENTTDPSQKNTDNGQQMETNDKTAGHQSESESDKNVTCDTKTPGSSKSDRLSCRMCGFSNKSASVVKDHILQSHYRSSVAVSKFYTFKGGKQKNMLKLKKDANSRLVHCPYCPKRTVKIQHMEYHIRTHTGEKPYACKLCSYESSRQCTIAQHVWVTHRMSAIDACMNTESCSTADTADTQRSSIQPGVYKLPTARNEVPKGASGGSTTIKDVNEGNTTVPTKDKANEHEDITTVPTKNLTIVIKDINQSGMIQSFSSETNASVSVVTNLSCRVCGFKGKTRSAVKHHIRRVHRSSATVVSKLFAFKNEKQEKNLNLKRDSESNFFRCPYCAKKSFFKYKMIAHIRCHTTEDPYHCNMCSFKTKRHIGILQHIWKMHETAAMELCIHQQKDNSGEVQNAQDNVGESSSKDFNQQFVEQPALEERSPVKIKPSDNEMKMDDEITVPETFTLQSETTNNINQPTNSDSSDSRKHPEKSGDHDQHFEEDWNCGGESQDSGADGTQHKECTSPLSDAGEIQGVFGRMEEYLQHLHPSLTEEGCETGGYDDMENPLSNVTMMAEVQSNEKDLQDGQTINANASATHVTSKSVERPGPIPSENQSSERSHLTDADILYSPSSSEMIMLAALLKASKSCCPYCDKRFHSAEDVVLHCRQHTGEEPYQCMHCKYKSSHKQPMVTHVRSQHKAKAPPPTCFSLFSFKTVSVEINVDFEQDPTTKKYICCHCQKESKTLKQAKLHGRHHTKHIKGAHPDLMESWREKGLATGEKVANASKITMVCTNGVSERGMEERVVLEDEGRVSVMDEDHSLQRKDDDETELEEAEEENFPLEKEKEGDSTRENESLNVASEASLYEVNSDTRIQQKNGISRQKEIKTKPQKQNSETVLTGDSRKAGRNKRDEYDFTDTESDENFSEEDDAREGKRIRTKVLENEKSKDQKVCVRNETSGTSEEEDWCFECFGAIIDGECMGDCGQKGKKRQHENDANGKIIAGEKWKETKRRSAGGMDWCFECGSLTINGYCRGDSARTAMKKNPSDDKLGSSHKIVGDKEVSQEGRRYGMDWCLDCGGLTINGDCTGDCSKVTKKRKFSEENIRNGDNAGEDNVEGRRESRRTSEGMDWCFHCGGLTVNVDCIGDCAKTRKRRKHDGENSTNGDNIGEDSVKSRRDTRRTSNGMDWCFLCGGLTVNGDCIGDCTKASKRRKHDGENSTNGDNIGEDSVKSRRETRRTSDGMDWCFLCGGLTVRGDCIGDCAKTRKRKKHDGENSTKGDNIGEDSMKSWRETRRTSDGMDWCFLCSGLTVSGDCIGDCAKTSRKRKHRGSQVGNRSSKVTGRGIGTRFAKVRRRRRRNITKRKCCENMKGGTASSISENGDTFMKRNNQKRASQESCTNIDHKYKVKRKRRVEHETSEDIIKLNHDYHIEYSFAERKMEQQLRKTGSKQCPYCHKAFTGYNSVIIHTRMHTGASPFVCLHCSQRCATRQNLLIHIVNLHWEKSNVVLRKYTACCDNKGRSKLGMKRKQRIHMCCGNEKKPFYCLLCSSHFQSRQGAKQHIIIRHGKVLQKEVAKLQQLPSSTGTLKKSMEFYTKPASKQHNLGDGGKSCSTGNGKPLNVEIADKVSNESCPQGGDGSELTRKPEESSNERSDLKKSRMAQLSTNAYDKIIKLNHDYRIEYCKAERKLAKELKSSRSKQCPYCDKKFRKTFEVIIHCRIHLGANPYVCLHCQHRCAHKQHMAIHMVSRQWEQSIATKAFSNMTGRCEKTAKKISGTHWRREHSCTKQKTKPVYCAVCSLHCKTMQQVKQHILFNHGEVLQKQMAELQQVESADDDKDSAAEPMKSKTSKDTAGPVKTKIITEETADPIVLKTTTKVAREPSKTISQDAAEPNAPADLNENMARDKTLDQSDQRPGTKSRNSTVAESSEAGRVSMEGAEGTDTKYLSTDVTKSGITRSIKERSIEMASDFSTEDAVGCEASHKIEKTTSTKSSNPDVTDVRSVGSKSTNETTSSIGDVDTEDDGTDEAVSFVTSTEISVESGNCASEDDVQYVAESGVSQDLVEQRHCHNSISGDICTDVEMGSGDHSDDKEMGKEEHNAGTEMCPENIRPILDASWDNSQNGTIDVETATNNIASYGIIEGSEIVGNIDTKDVESCLDDLLTLSSRNVIHNDSKGNEEVADVVGSKMPNVSLAKCDKFALKLNTDVFVGGALGAMIEPNSNDDADVVGSKAPNADPDSDYNFALNTHVTGHEASKDFEAHSNRHVPSVVKLEALDSVVEGVSNSGSEISGNISIEDTESDVVDDDNIGAEDSTDIGAEDSTECVAFSTVSTDFYADDLIAISKESPSSDAGKVDNVTTDDDVLDCGVAEDDVITCDQSATVKKSKVPDIFFSPTTWSQSKMPGADVVNENYYASDNDANFVAYSSSPRDFYIEDSNNVANESNLADGEFTQVAEKVGDNVARFPSGKKSVMQTVRVEDYFTKLIESQLKDGGTHREQLRMSKNIASSDTDILTNCDSVTSIDINKIRAACSDQDQVDSDDSEATLEARETIGDVHGNLESRETTVDLLGNFAQIKTESDSAQRGIHSDFVADGAGGSKVHGDQREKKFETGEEVGDNVQIKMEPISAEGENRSDSVTCISHDAVSIRVESHNTETQEAREEAMDVGVDTVQIKVEPYSPKAYNHSACLTARLPISTVDSNSQKFPILDETICGNPSEVNHNHSIWSPDSEISPSPRVANGETEEMWQTSSQNFEAALQNGQILAPNEDNEVNQMATPAVDNNMNNTTSHLQGISSVVSQQTPPAQKQDPVMKTSNATVMVTSSASKKLQTLLMQDSNPQESPSFTNDVLKVNKDSASQQQSIWSPVSQPAEPAQSDTFQGNKDSVDLRQSIWSPFSQPASHAQSQEQVRNTPSQSVSNALPDTRPQIKQLELPNTPSPNIANPSQSSWSPMSQPTASNPRSPNIDNPSQRSWSPISQPSASNPRSPNIDNPSQSSWSPISQPSASNPRPTVDFIYEPSSREKLIWDKQILQCPVCSVEKTSTKDVMSHMRERHTLETPFRCCHCMFSAMNLPTMVDHVNRLHTASLFDLCHSFHICQWGQTAGNGTSKPCNPKATGKAACCPLRSDNEFYHCSTCGFKSFQLPLMADHVQKAHKKCLHVEVDPSTRDVVCPVCLHHWDDVKIAMKHRCTPAMRNMPFAYGDGTNTSGDRTAGVNARSSGAHTSGGGRNNDATGGRCGGLSGERSSDGRYGQAPNINPFSHRYFPDMSPHVLSRHMPYGQTPSESSQSSGVQPPPPPPPREITRRYSSSTEYQSDNQGEPVPHWGTYMLHDYQRQEPRNSVTGDSVSKRNTLHPYMPPSARQYPPPGGRFHTEGRRSPHSPQFPMMNQLNEYSSDSQQNTSPRFFAHPPHQNVNAIGRCGWYPTPGYPSFAPMPPQQIEGGQQRVEPPGRRVSDTNRVPSKTKQVGPTSIMDAVRTSNAARASDDEVSRSREQQATESLPVILNVTSLINSWKKDFVGSRDK